MAETKKGQKFNRIAPYTKADGTKVRGYVRSNPYTSRGAVPKGRKKG